MARVYLVGSESDCEVFVSLEQAPVVLGRVRTGLLGLKRELNRKWRVQSVDVEARPSRRRNPFHPGDVAVPACVGIVIRYFWSVADRAGKKTGDAIGEEIAEHVRRWLETVGKPKSRKKSRRR